MKNKTTKTGENKMSETITRTRDEVNPDYMFQSTNVELLASAMQGKIDLNALAWRELRCRGLDEYGNWIGFDKPEKETLVMKFKAKAKELLPGQDGLQDLDNDINSAGHIDEVMFRKSEYLGGMAAVILAILEK